MMRLSIKVVWLGLIVAAVPVAASAPSPETLIDAGHFKRARAILEPRVQANPNDARAPYLLGQVRQAYGDLDGALKLAEKAAALDSRNGDYRYLVAELYGQKAEKASIFSQFGLARRFKKEAEAALALDPKLVDPRWALMEFHMQAPGIVGGNKKTAYALAQEIAHLDPPRGYLAQARLARFEKKTDSPEALYLKALEANPNSYGTRITLANFYSSDAQKKYELAEKYAREAMKLEPSCAGAYSMLAQIFALQQRWPDLDAILAQAEKNVPDFTTPPARSGASGHTIFVGDRPY